ncbi:Uncharacterized membrane protein YsdA, DUF1294 family [Caloramator proteoclasticus DSM 10124]|uniref:Uncharacterized membrane protein YsdA, DUF1294 family n=1 Tax=Caloramator proteoclasticus DSM 10124 TaxID=1121262 RepID=A0A1M4VM58_9CLOT|nr:DUF1294 domain-containing protein [Caloramator proteoclasticus]SHE69880.1 Uncharacterized membrane protein YsdA, DUF1294 family [Caloramator proteoclasticus DSM 10124]
MLFEYYLLIVNILGILLIMIDKFKAKYKRWRIRENTLLIVALIGGSIGVYLSMYLFHHKTRKPKFRYGVPAIIILQLLISFLIFK